MSGNWFRASVIGLSLFLFFPAAASAQGEARYTSATLDTVVVTATRTEEKLREVTSNVTIITEEMIKKSSASDLGQLLRQQGLDVAGNSGGGAGMRQIRLRGMAPSMDYDLGINDITSAALVLLNGRRIGGPSPDFIGLTNVERIEIIRGPSAVQYGPSAMGGVVNIITKRGGEKTEIRAEAGAGSYDLERLKLAASGQGGDGRVDFAFGAGQQYQGDFKTGDGWVWDGTRTGNRKALNGDLGVNLEEGQRLGVNYNYFGFFGAEAPENQPSYANPAKPPYDSHYGTSYDATNSNVAITYDGSSENKAFNWQGRFSFGQHENKMFSVSDMSKWGMGMVGDSIYKTTTTTGLTNLTTMLGYDEGGLFALSGGLDYLVYDIDILTDSSGYANYSNPEYTNFGSFLSGKLRFLDDSLIFSAGGRFDSYEIESDDPLNPKESQTNISPSLGLAYLPLDWLKLRGNYSQGFRMPTPSQIWDTGNPYFEANPDLEPEKSKTWEVGLDANWEFFNAGLTYFHSKWADKIISKSTGPMTSRFENISGATIAGYELALSADLGQALKQDFTLRPYVNLTYMPTLRADDPNVVKTQKGDDTLAYTSETTMSYGLDFAAPNIDLTANINASYTGKKLAQDFTDPAYPAPWVYLTPGTIVDMSLEKGLVEFADKGKLKARAEVNNLMDKYYQAHPGYPEAGRNFYVGLVYSY